MGDTQGEAVVYNWTPPSIISLLPELIPWLIIMTLILILKKKDRRVPGILIPLISSFLLLVIISQFLPNEIKDVVFRLLSGLILSQAAIWLILGRLVEMNRRRVFLQTVFIMLLFGFFFFITFDSQTPNEKAAYMILYALSTLTIHFAIILSRFLVRRRFTPVRFTILLPFFNIITLLPMFFTAVFIITLATSATVNPGLFLMTLIICSVLGSILFITTLPYLILVFRNGYYREIFNRIFRLGEQAQSNNDQPE